MKHYSTSALGFVFLALPVVAQNEVWVRQFGTSLDDVLSASTPDAVGGVFVTGTTRGNLGGSNAGSVDIWFARYDSTGNQSWIKQLGSSNDDTPNAIAHAGTNGVYIAGHTYGSLGALNTGFQDAFLARYDNSGNLVWVRQFGTSSIDVAYDVAPDAAGGAYVAGYTQGNLGGTNLGNSDAWLARYDSAGNRTWIRQFGTSGYESASALAADTSGGVYVGGGSSGDIGGGSAGGQDAWLARYNSAGTRSWIRQFGSSSDDGALAAAQDGSGGVCVSGRTLGNLGGSNAGGEDVWLARYGSNGTQAWIRHLGSSAEDVLARAASDGSGGVCICGYTEGNLGGPNAGGRDAWIARFDGAGSRTWLGQIGTSASDYAKGVASGGAGSIYVGGQTNGSLGGPSAGGPDAWLARYDSTCGVSSNYCTAGTTTHGCVPSIACTGSVSASTGSGFAISVSSVEGQKSGLIFYGLSNAGWSPTPWANGSTSFLCVKAPTQRTPTQNSGGTINTCNGVLTIDWNAFIATHPGSVGTPFVGGETVWVQAWFRDPPAPKTTNLSNGLMFTVCP